MWAGRGGSERHTNGGSTGREDFEARVAGREDAGNGDMMYSGDLRCTMTTGGSVGPPVELEGSSAADAQGSGDTGRSHGTRVGAVPAGTEGGRYEGVACNNMMEHDGGGGDGWGRCTAGWCESPYWQTTPWQMSPATSPTLVSTPTPLQVLVATCSCASQPTRVTTGSPARPTSQASGSSGSL